MQLVPCGVCCRHVVASERACPFCGEKMGSDPISRGVLGRVSRAAVFGVGATTAACWTSSSPATTNTTGGGSQTVSNKSGGGEDADRFEVPAPQAGMASIAGVCRDAANGQPLAGARVEMIAGVGAGRKDAVTDSQGRYAVTDVPPGEWNVRFWPPNDPGRMAPASQFLTVKAGDAKRIDGTVQIVDWSNVPMPYGAPPQRRRVV
jgi:hypothetical protein